MPGKGVLILVIGFTIIFMTMGYFWGNISTRAVENDVNYYKKTIANNIAVSGMNVMLRKLHANFHYNTNINNLPFQDGLADITVDKSDTLAVRLVSTGEYMGTEKTVEVVLGRSTYAKYAYFVSSVSTGGTQQRVWTSGDSLFGAFHSNQFLNINGNPVFLGKVSTSRGLKMATGSKPKFLGGLTTGVNVPWEQKQNLDYPKAAAVEGANQGGSCVFNSTNLWLHFNADGTVTYRTGTGTAGGDTTKYGAPITKPLTEMAPTGAIYLDKGDIYLSGTLKGQVTIVADQSSGTGGGNVYIVDDIIYSTPPMIRVSQTEFVPNEQCTDLMGIISTNNIFIATDVASGGYQNNVVEKDLVIDAGIMALSGGFSVQNLNTINTKIGILYLNGSMVAGKEEVIAKFDNNNNVVAGYTRNIVHDQRFITSPPLWFPYLEQYEIVAWYE